ncbi:MAG: histidine kinase, partial [Bacteroidota bacterium]
VFVVPIAAAGVIKFGATDSLADSFVLALPLAEGHMGLALLAFIGGVSAATSMVIVATIALSIMASNHLVVPLLLRTSLLKDSFATDLSPRLRNLRRAVILAILMISYLYYRTLDQDEPLVAIGLISFTAVAQFAPALLGGIYWKGATRTGAIAGMIAGFLVWLYTLPLVNLLENSPIIDQGPWGWTLLRPQALLGLEGLAPIPHAAFWSLFINVLFFVAGSLYTKPSEIEQQQARLFTDIFKKDQIAVGRSWESRARLQDIQGLLSRFLGQQRSDDLLNAYLRRNNISLKPHSEVGSDLINYSERLLAGAIGSASSRFMVSTIVKQTPLTHHDMMEVLDETQQLVRYSRELEKK